MKNDFQNYIILKIRRLREERKISQLQLSYILGISPGQMGNIESCRQANKYTLEQIYKISKTFNIPIEQIFLDEEDFNNGNNFVENLILKIIDYEGR